MSEDVQAILERIRRGIADVKDANELETILKGGESEQEQKVSIEVLCTCRDGSCSSPLPKR